MDISNGKPKSNKICWASFFHFSHRADWTVYIEMRFTRTFLGKQNATEEVKFEVTCIIS